MVPRKTKPKKDEDAEGENDPKLEKTKNRQASSHKANVRVRDISNVSGKVQLAGGDIITYEEATEAKNRAEFERKELQELNASISEMLESLRTLSTAPPEVETSFHSQELQLNEGKSLLGRAALLEQLLRTLRSKRTLFLSGRGGVGRTSLLQAGLMPRLLEQGHLPVLVSISGGSLVHSIMHSVYPHLDSTIVLKTCDLVTFLDEAAQFVPGNGQLVLLLDGYEYAEGLEDFQQEWHETLSDTIQHPKLRWVFSIDQGFTTKLAALEPEEVLDVPPLDCATAAQALRRLEQDGLQIEEPYLNEILNELGKHRDSTAESCVNPCDLQIVLKAVAEDRSSRSLSKIYEQQEGVNGIFEKYLVRTVNSPEIFSASQRGIVWQILTFLREEYGTPVSAGWIRSRLSAYGFETTEVPGLLKRLRTHHIISAAEESFELAHVNLVRGIRKHLEKEKLREKVYADSLKQLDNLRASALRGLLAGAVGLAIFRRIVSDPIPDLAANIWVTMLFAPAGGLTGLLLTFFIDVFIAHNRGTRPWQRYLISAATGFVTFALALALYVYLEEHGGDTLSQFLLAMIVGGAWGTVAGIGIAWATCSTQVQPWKVPLVALLSALTLYLFNLIFPVLNRATPLEVLIGAFWFPLVIIAATVLWRPADPFASFERST